MTDTPNKPVKAWLLGKSDGGYLRSVFFDESAAGIHCAYLNDLTAERHPNSGFTISVIPVTITKGQTDE